MSDTQVLIQTTGWNTEMQQDEPTDSIAVSIMLPISGTEGKWFTKECKTAEDLWNYLQALDREPVLTLAWNFDYHAPGPPKPRSADELLSQLL